MTDDTADSAEELPIADKPAAKKAARKRPTKKKVPKAEDDPSAPGERVADEPKAAEAPAAREVPEAPEKPSEGQPAVTEHSGIETREIESENARRVSSKRVKPAGKPRDSGRSESAGDGRSSGEDESPPVMKEPDGGDDAGGGKRRRRRRRRGGSDEPESPEPGVRQRPALDPDAVASKAWKIYKAEVAEEGLALINDNDARELSRRSFRLAEVFLEEEARRH